jgi:4-hydroxy-tetrahydrodipicolinate synthase
MGITTNPIPVKAALNLLGHRVGGLRLPLIEADEAELAEIRGALEAHGLTTAAA